MHNGISAKIGARAVLFIALGIAASLGLLGNGGQVSANTAGLTAGAAAKIESEVLQDTNYGKSAPFIVLMADQADLSAAPGMRDQDARGWYVYNTLRAHAERTQASIRSMLDGIGVQYEVLWIVNGLQITGDRALVNTISARSDVRKLESDRAYRAIDPIEETSVSSPSNPLAVEWGVQRVNAPQVWAMGYTGQGIVIANQDTGMQWDHPALKPHYRGWNGTTADHNYNWWDGVRTPSIHNNNPCGYASVVPCDDSRHGTHTTGTTVGDDGQGNQIGVAPGAKWIGCHNMDQGDGRPSTYLSCFQFFMAPTDLNGQNANAALRPHVMNNSWGCPPSEQCAPDSLQSAVEASEASGIFVEVSAGNSGSSCGSVNDPPGIYAASFTTGAIDINNALAPFSSRGPVTIDGSNRLKPNISGPGVNVRSSVPGSAYSSMSGTSMSGPHVVGVVALLWSAKPNLVRQIDETKALLEQTANHDVSVNASEPYCGNTPPSQIPNNYFGYGRVDALAALNVANGATATPTTRTTSTATTAPTNTSTAVPTSTSTTTPLPTSTATATATASATQTATHTQTATASMTSTSIPTATRTASATSTSAPIPSGTPTVMPPLTGTPTSTGTATMCPIQFEDVLPTGSSSTFYPFVRCLACKGIISGYQCGGVGEPCNANHDPYFRPNNPVSRGQIAKIVAQSAGFTDVVPQGQQTFEDVVPLTPFHPYVERLASRGIVGGYQCGLVANELCIPPLNRKYYRPDGQASRGQLAKIVSEAAGFHNNIPANQQTFTDVPSDNAFWVYVERLLSNRPGVMSGYPCGGQGEPCDAQHRNYFRWGNPVTRGQASKIGVGTFFPGCNPARR